MKDSPNSVGCICTRKKYTTAIVILILSLFFVGGCILFGIFYVLAVNCFNCSESPVPNYCKECAKPADAMLWVLVAFIIAMVVIITVLFVLCCRTPKAVLLDPDDSVSTVNL